MNKHLKMPDDAERVNSAFLRPTMLQLRYSKNISIRDVTLKNSPFWTINPVYCENLTVSGFTIENGWKSSTDSYAATLNLAV